MINSDSLWLFLVLDLAQIVLHTVAASPPWLVLHHMIQNVMIFVAPLLARLTNPVDIAGLATKVVVEFAIILNIVESHAFKRL